MSPRSLFPLVLIFFCAFAAGHETRESRSLKQSDGVMAGAYGSADVQSTRVQDIAAFDIEALNLAENSGLLEGLGLIAPIALANVQAASIQVVNGLNYKLTLQVVDINSMKMSIQVITYVDLQDNKSLQSALPTTPGSPQTGGDGIRPLLGATRNPPKTSNSSTSNNTNTGMGSGMGSMAGGYNPADVKSDVIQAIAEMNIKKLNSGHNKAKLAGLGLKQPVKLVKVKSAETQIVAGTNYKLDLLVKDKSGKKASLETVTFSDLKGVDHLESVTKNGAPGGTGAVGNGKVSVTCSCSSPPSMAIVTMDMMCQAGTNFAGCCEMGDANRKCTAVPTAKTSSPQLGGGTGSGQVNVLCACSNPPSNVIATHDMMCQAGTSFAGCCQMGDANAKCTGSIIAATPSPSPQTGSGKVSVTCSCKTPPSTATVTMDMMCQAGTSFAGCCQMGNADAKCTFTTTPSTGGMGGMLGK